MPMHPALTAGRGAVITGGASGIGLAAAKRFAALGMRICIADRDDAQLTAAAAEIAKDGGKEVLTVKTDVSDIAQVQALKDKAFATFGDVAVLMNNAGTGGGGGPWSSYEGWQRVLGVNLWGVINGVHAFAEAMIAQGQPAAIVNTGSKQGITNPPGDTAYNVSKAGIRTLTDGLAHQLRNTPNCQVSAHLLVPGFTFTGLTRQRASEKPPAAWWPEQVVEELFTCMGNGDFYIICPDNDVTREMDNKRVQWNTDDIVHNRPALSRWHEGYAAAFAEYMSTIKPG